MADRGGIQLLPETRKRIDVKVPGENRWLSIGIFSALIAAGAYLGIHFYNQSLQTQLDDLDAELVLVEKSRDKKMEAELVSLGKQANLMSKLLTNHIFMTKALSQVERLMHGELQLKNFSASAPKEQVAFNATARSYSTIARQIASFTADDGIKDLVLGNIRSMNTGNFEFGMELKFDPSKFLKK